MFSFSLQDFCYENDPDNFSMMDVINMCVTVVAYAPDSFRAVQMLVGTQRYTIFISANLQSEKKKKNNNNN